MEELEADLAVIGSGPGGQKAAIQAAKLGRRVLVIECDEEVGGACLNSGTIPSKSLREAIVDLTRFYERSFYGRQESRQEISINDLNFRLGRVLEDERRLIRRQFQKNQIRLLHGWASFASPWELFVRDGSGSLIALVKAKKICIATGSRPRNPIEVPFDDEVILDSTRLLSIDQLPNELLVLGAGIVGSEYASYFSALGSKVTIIDKRDHLLPLLDSEIGIHLQMALSEIGLSFKGQMRPKKIERKENRAYVSFEDGSELSSDKLLYALGRIAAVEDLKLEEAGISLSSMGFIPVNRFFQTEQEHIYAVGDVIGAPALAATSFEQGRLAARHAFQIHAPSFPLFYPLGIYTIPEISSIGYTENQLQRMGAPYEVGRAYYYEIARGHISGSQSGMFKILCHKETHKILGVHIIGRSATELIHIGQLALFFNATIDTLVSQVFNYPTFAEGYRIAALNALNKLH